jgi:hypothetical protein
MPNVSKVSYLNPFISVPPLPLAYSSAAKCLETSATFSATACGLLMNGPCEVLKSTTSHVTPVFSIHISCRNDGLHASASVPKYTRRFSKPASAQQGAVAFVSNTRYACGVIPASRAASSRGSQSPYSVSRTGSMIARPGLGCDASKPVCCFDGPFGSERHNGVWDMPREGITCRNVPYLS